MGLDPSLHAPRPLQIDALAEFSRREAEFDPAVAHALKSLGGEAIEAYASVQLYHNTLNTLVPTIMTEGLRANNEAAVPTPEDVAFAEVLFHQKGYSHPDSIRQFNRYIKGEVADRQPGVFFYGVEAERAGTFNKGYGQPERLRIFTSEMGYVMNYENGPYSQEERAHARDLYLKYQQQANGGDEGYIAVLQANPFSPVIFNERLKMLPGVDTSQKEYLVRALRVLGLREFEGMYIPGTVPPEDLTVLDEHLPIFGGLDEDKLDPSKSRFFYTPPHMQRA